MIRDFLTALGDLFRPGARSVLALGMALALALLAAIYALFVVLIGWLVPDTITLPWIGAITWVDDLMSWASVGLMLLLSFFLMVPVASAFTGLFLDRVADSVEARHYPGLPPARNVPLAEALRDSLGFLGVIIAVNALALVGYLLVGPAAPLLFWAVNGYLLGREYFQMVALRRMDRTAARAFYKAHRLRVWGAGVLMALPLSLPVMNLIVPVLGAATFTHLFHRVKAGA